MMKIILIYFLLFAFWAEKVLGFKLTHTEGLSLSNVSIYLLLIAWAFSVITRRRLFEANKINKYIILLILIALFSIPLKWMLGEISNFSIVRELIYLKSWSNPFILFFIVFNIVDDKSACDKTLVGLFVFLMVTVLSVLFITYSGANLGTLKVVQEGRSAGFAEPNQYATFLVLFIPFLLTYSLFQSQKSIKIGAILLLILTMISLLITGSRGGIFSFLVSIFTYLTILYRKRLKKLAPIFIIFAGIFVLVVSSFILAPSDVKRKVEERLDPGQSKNFYEYTSGRTVLWANGLKLFIKRPIVGHGQGSFLPLMRQNFRISGASHNDYLQYLVEHGVIGLLVFILIFVKVFQQVSFYINTVPDSWRKLIYISYIAGFCGYVFSMFGVNVILPRYHFWIYTAVILKYGQSDLNRQV